MLPFDPSADAWEAEAKRYVEAAQALLSMSLLRQAYIQAATAIECAVKCKIMRRNGLNRWPTRQEKREYYTHNLMELVEYAGLLSEVNSQMSLASAIGSDWMVAKDFAMAHRYPERPLSKQAVMDMVAASERLVPWLLS